MGQQQQAAEGAAIEQSKPAKPQSVGAQLKSAEYKAALASALPSHVDPERFGRIVLSAVHQTPKLAQCTVQSFTISVMQLAQLGLEPNTPAGHAYLIPRNNSRRKTVECTAQIGYRGYIELFLRTGMVSNVKAFAVHEGDDFDFDEVTDHIRFRRQSDPKRLQKPVTHAVAIARMKDGAVQTVVLDRADIERRKSFSQATGASDPWGKHYAEMACKSAVRALEKWMPKSPEIVTAVTLDDPTKRSPQLRNGDDVAALLASGEESRTEYDVSSTVEGEDVPEYDPETGEVA